MSEDVVRMELAEIPGWLEREGLRIVGMEGDVLVVAPIVGVEDSFEEVTRLWRWGMSRCVGCCVRLCWALQGRREVAGVGSVAGAGVVVGAADRKICKFTFGRRYGAGAGVWEKRLRVGRISKVMRPKMGEVGQTEVGVVLGWAALDGIRRAWVGRITRAGGWSGEKMSFQGASGK